MGMGCNVLPPPPPPALPRVLRTQGRVPLSACRSLQSSGGSSARAFCRTFSAAVLCASAPLRLMGSAVDSAGDERSVKFDVPRSARFPAEIPRHAVLLQLPPELLSPKARTARCTPSSSAGRVIGENRKPVAVLSARVSGVQSTIESASPPVAHDRRCRSADCTSGSDRRARNARASGRCPHRPRSGAPVLSS